MLSVRSASINFKTQSDSRSNWKERSSAPPQRTETHSDKGTSNYGPLNAQLAPRGVDVRYWPVNGGDPNEKAYLIVNGTSEHACSLHAGRGDRGSTLRRVGASHRRHVSERGFLKKITSWAHVCPSRNSFSHLVLMNSGVCWSGPAKVCSHFKLGPSILITYSGPDAGSQIKSFHVSDLGRVPIPASTAS